jgi:hypothetical protein
MNVIARTTDRILVSLSKEELDLVRSALQTTSAIPGHAPNNREEVARRSLEILEQLDAPCARQGCVDVVEVWADGGVQVRAITVFGDPVDMSDDEARDFADRIRACASDG